MTKRELVKRLFSFYNKCLRLVRAYNFKDLIGPLEKYHMVFTDIKKFKYSKYILDKDIIDLRFFISQCSQKLTLKAENDPNLKDNEAF